MKITVRLPSGKTVETVVNSDTAVVGRSPKCDMPIPEEALSRQHCKIELENGIFHITDLNSANGVYLNGNRLSPQVKTPFNTFDQLTLGLLECYVEDFEIVDPATVIPHPRPSKRDSSDQTLTRAIDRKTLDKHRSKKNKQQSKEIVIGFIVPIILLGLAVAYYLSTEDEVAVPTTATVVTDAPSSVSKKAVSAKAPNKFHEISEYKTQLKNSDCDKFKRACRSLALDNKQAEGIVKKDDEYFLYLNPALHTKLPHQKDVLKLELGPDLVAFETLIKSSFFDHYILGRVTQLHLVLINPEGRLLKIYRFHQDSYPPKKIVRTQLINSIKSAVIEQKPSLFFSSLDSLIPSMTVVKK